VFKKQKSFALMTMLAALLLTSPSFADDYVILTKAPAALAPAATVPATCASIYDFATTNCVLRWWGVSFYGTVDLGAAYQTHGTPFDPNYSHGASYLLGNGGYFADGRLAGFFPAPNGLGQSLVGVKWDEPIGAGWSFIGVGELAFDPESGLLSNGPQALQDSIGVPEGAWLLPIDSSRWGWLAGQIYAGVNSPTWGTLTFGRQNALLSDAVVAYDAMAGAYAFSLASGSGKTGGAGDTEDARWTTAIKYRVNVGAIRIAAEVQPIFGRQYWGYNPNNGAVSAGIGGDIRGVGPGILSTDFFGTYERDAVNITASITSAGVGPTGWLTPAGVADPGFLKATISNQTSFMYVGKYTFGSWGNSSQPIVGKEAPPPSGPHGIPLTIYWGYEFINFANPSDPQTAFRDDGFLFATLGANGAGNTPGPNGTTINNNAFNSNCGSGAGCTNEIFQVFWTGAKYGINKDLDFITGWYHYLQNTYVNPNGTATAQTCSPAGAAGNSRCQGWFDVASVVLDWRFLPKWDAYIGTMYSAAYGGLAYGDIARQNIATTVGVRFRF
jgi:hypothetical protein